MAELDKIDNNILKILAVDGRISVTELSKRVGLSKTPCQIRMKRLQKNGFILGFRAIIDPNKMDAGHVAFINVTLSETTSKALNHFNEAVRAISEIEQCHMIASNFDYLLKVRTKNIADYRVILGEKISSLPYVSHTSTFVVMETVKDVNVRKIKREKHQAGD